MTKGFYKTEVWKSSKNISWTTPKEYYDKVNAEFNFTLDAAALSSSTLVADNWYGLDHPDESRRDAFARDWTSDSPGAIWLNPPYGKTIKDWLRKANDVASGGGVVVCLVPARTDTSWWHDYCIHHEIRFIRGRLKFGGQKNSAPFPSALVVMKPTVERGGI